jgi:hypothetical protein
MTIFHVVRRQCGPRWDRSRPLEKQSGWDEHASFMDGLVDAGFIILGGPLDRDDRVVCAVEAGSREEVTATLARDPWSGTHLLLEAVEPWIIRLGSPTAHHT